MHIVFLVICFHLYNVLSQKLLDNNFLDPILWDEILADMYDDKNNVDMEFVASTLLNYLCNQSSMKFMTELREVVQKLFFVQEKDVQELPIVEKLFVQFMRELKRSVLEDQMKEMNELKQRIDELEKIIKK